MAWTSAGAGFDWVSSGRALDRDAWDLVSEVVLNATALRNFAARCAPPVNATVVAFADAFDSATAPTAPAAVGPGHRHFWTSDCRVQSAPFSLYLFIYFSLSLSLSLSPWCIFCPSRNPPLLRSHTTLRQTLSSSGRGGLRLGKASQIALSLMNAGTVKTWVSFPPTALSPLLQGHFFTAHLLIRC